MNFGEDSDRLAQRRAALKAEAMADYQSFVGGNPRRDHYNPAQKSHMPWKPDSPAGQQRSVLGYGAPRQDAQAAAGVVQGWESTPSRPQAPQQTSQQRSPSSRQSQRPSSRSQRPSSRQQPPPAQQVQPSRRAPSQSRLSEDPLDDTLAALERERDALLLKNERELAVRREIANLRKLEDAHQRQEQAIQSVEQQQVHQQLRQDIALLKRELSMLQQGGAPDQPQPRQSGAWNQVEMTPQRWQEVEQVAPMPQQQQQQPQPGVQVQVEKRATFAPGVASPRSGQSRQQQQRPQESPGAAAAQQSPATPSMSARRGNFFGDPAREAAAVDRKRAYAMELAAQAEADRQRKEREKRELEQASARDEAAFARAVAQEQSEVQAEKDKHKPPRTPGLDSAAGARRGGANMETGADHAAVRRAQEQQHRAELAAQIEENRRRKAAEEAAEEEADRRDSMRMQADQNELARSTDLNATGDLARTGDSLLNTTGGHLGRSGGGGGHQSGAETDGEGEQHPEGDYQDQQQPQQAGGHEAPQASPSEDAIAAAMKLLQKKLSIGGGDLAVSIDGESLDSLRKMNREQARENRHLRRQVARLRSVVTSLEDELETAHQLISRLHENAPERRERAAQNGGRHQHLQQPGYDAGGGGGGGGGLHPNYGVGPTHDGRVPTAIPAQRNRDLGGHSYFRPVTVASGSMAESMADMPVDVSVLWPPNDGGDVGGRGGSRGGGSGGRELGARGAFVEVPQSPAGAGGYDDIDTELPPPTAVTATSHFVFPDGTRAEATKMPGPGDVAEGGGQEDALDTLLRDIQSASGRRPPGQGRTGSRGSGAPPPQQGGNTSFMYPDGNRSIVEV